MKRGFPILLVALVILAIDFSARAGLLNSLESAVGSTNSAAVISALPQDQIASGLKEALGKGVQHAVASLGHHDGFLTNLNVKIPLPGKLQSVEKVLEAAGQSQVVDEFIASMNHAAEQAVPVAASVFGDSIQQMTIADAKAILSSTNDAATQYFRRTTQTNLYAKFYPLVQKATDSVGVTSYYKEMMGKFSSAGSLGDSLGGMFGKKSPVNFQASDIDAYVTNKAMDGLFKMVAEEEKNIRANPMARTTDLLKQVFGPAK
jgi:hypothetical protein